jgi:hypothetical protein
MSIASGLHFSWNDKSSESTYNQVLIALSYSGMQFVNLVFFFFSNPLSTVLDYLTELS